MTNKSSKFREHACSFKNEAECEEEIEEDGLSLDEAEEEFFKDKEVFED